MDFLVLIAKANKQIKLIHHNFSPHKVLLLSSKQVPLCMTGTLLECNF